MLESSENGSENADNTSSQDGDNNGNNGTSPHGTGDNGDGNGGNTDVAGEEQTGEGSIQSEYDINGVGISSDDSTEETTSSDGEIQQAEKKPMPKAVKILLTVLWWAVIIVGAVFALRYAELMRRKKLAENAPEKAAAEIYRMLARLAAMQGVCVSAEKLPEQLKRTSALNAAILCLRHCGQGSVRTAASVQKMRRCLQNSTALRRRSLSADFRQKKQCWQRSSCWTDIQNNGNKKDCCACNSPFLLHFYCIPQKNRL